MKAWILEDIGKINYVEDAPLPAIKENEVLVKVKAVGICGSDIPRVFQNGAHKMPLIIGHEFSGQVEKIGIKVNNKWQNKRVGIFPLMPCMECSACKAKKYEMCSNYNYLGSRTNGAFAEYVAVPEWNLIEIPDNVSFEQAAMLEPMAVAVHAMRRLDFNEDMSVAICGLGTIGQFLTMFLLEKGIKNLYAIGNKKLQKDSVLSLGLPEENYYDYTLGNPYDWIFGKTNGKLLNAYFDCVGKNETFATGLKLAGNEAQICIVGNPYTDINIPKELHWGILKKQLRITGTWNSSFYGESDDVISDDWKYVIYRLSKNLIHPENLITHRFPLGELESGLKIMNYKLDEYIKILVIQ